MDYLSKYHKDKLSIPHMEEKKIVYITYRKFVYMWYRQNILSILGIEKRFSSLLHTDNFSIYNM